MDKVNDFNESAIFNDVPEISGFLKQLSNDIRYPINRIIGSAELISREEISPKVRDSLLDIRMAANKMAHLTEDLIDLVRISNHELEILEEEYCFEDIVLDLRRTIERDTAQKGIDGEINIDESIPYRLLGDEKRLRMMLFRLVNNAIRVSNKGKVSITSKCIPVSEERVCLRFDISDSGDGILSEELLEVFKGKGAAFEQGVLGVEGLAVDVFLIKYFASHMGGKLSVKAIQGVGCTFTLLVCQDTVGEITLEESHAVSAAVGSKIPFSAPAARILLSGREHEFTKELYRQLCNYQIFADLTFSCNEVLRLCHKIKYDLIILAPLDEEGVEEGVKEIREACAQNERANIPIVAAYTGEGELQRLLGKMINNDSLTVSESGEAAEQKYVHSEGLPGHLIYSDDNEELERILRTYLPVDRLEYSAEYAHGGRGIEVLENLGLNISAALANFAGDEEEYKDVLLSMCRSSDTKIKMLNYYLDQHDYKNYIVAMHGILGVAQVIGADDIADRSRELEKAAKLGQRDIIESETPAFGEDFEKLLSAVSNAIATKEKNTNKGAIDKEDLLAIINELKGYLSDYQINEVEELFYALAQFSYYNEKVMELIHQAEEQMLSYSYNEVIATLDSIITEIREE